MAKQQKTQTKKNHPADIHTFKHIYFLYFKEIISHPNHYHSRNLDRFQKLKRLNMTKSSRTCNKSCQIYTGKISPENFAGFKAKKLETKGGFWSLIIAVLPWMILSSSLGVSILVWRDLAFQIQFTLVSDEHLHI